MFDVEKPKMKDSEIIEFLDNMKENELKKKKNIYATLGASSHSLQERQSEDYYATDPIAGKLLLTLEKFNHNIWECACGEGYLSEVFKKAGYNVKSSDLINRGYGEVLDFLSVDNTSYDGDIITNPPYIFAEEFIEKSLSIIPIGNKIAMFLKVTFLEGKKRKNMFLENPPKIIYISSSRINCARDGDFDTYKSSAIAYAWYVWEKGYKGNTILKWFN